MNLNLSDINRWTVLSGAVLMAVVIQACAIVPPPPVEPKPNVNLVGDQSAKVRELRKQIRERDQRIEELESQLEALKLIDQDSSNQKTLLRPPATLPPIQ